MIILGKNSDIIRSGTTTFFSPRSGIPPFTYAVLAGGAGGTINSDGMYTAPYSAGDVQRDTIEVTDSLGEKGMTSISIVTPIEIVCAIIKKAMNLSADQVYIYNQKYDIPKDSRLYVVVGVLSSKVFGNSAKVMSDGTTVVHSINMQETLSISLLSKGLSARTRKEEIAMATNSVFSKQMQEMNSFFIGPNISPFNNVSDNEGMAMVNHFNTNIVIQYSQRKITSEDYFDTFNLDDILTNQ